jgi:hypothetical protein
MKRLALTGFALALASVASAEQFYKWQDESGAWHYTMQAPKDRQSQSVVVNAGTGRVVQTQGEGVAAADNEKAPPKTGETPRGEPVAATPENIKKNQDAEKARVANCERAKTNVATLESYSAVTVQRDGKDVKLDEAEHLAELKRARAQVEIFCK